MYSFTLESELGTIKR